MKARKEKSRKQKDKNRKEEDWSMVMGKARSKELEAERTEEVSWDLETGSRKEEAKTRELGA